MSGWLVNDIQRFTASSRRLYELSCKVPAIQSPKISVSGVNDAPKEIRGSVSFDHVSFSYGGPEGSRVLSDIDFSVEAGETIGIVGPTGSGKSTIARLLSRFYDPTEGRILLDGRDLRDLPVETLRRNVGVAMQDVFLYSDTIEGNIAFGKPALPMEKVLEASRMACADGFVRELSSGYDTIVGERGVGLSGGQKQRVALARLIAMDPPVMILDDTMSAVDVETEEELQESIKALRGSRTLFIIAHRISSVKHADQILVIKDGRIAERGRHSQLLAARGLYAEVCRHQAGMEN
jgi:ATP-binding cassette, subfamily B, multidrug efflux pump